MKTIGKVAIYSLALIVNLISIISTFSLLLIFPLGILCGIYVIWNLIF